MWGTRSLSAGTERENPPQQKRPPGRGDLSAVWAGLVVVPPLQGWAVVAWLLFGIRRVRIAVCGAGATQSRLVALASVVQFALVLDARQAGLDVVELRGGHDILRTRRQFGGNLLLRRLNAIRGLRVARESFGNHVRLGFLQVLQLFKDGDESLGIVAGTVHVLHTEEVGLRFKTARELQEGQRNSYLRRLVNAIAGPASDKNQRNGAQLSIVHAGLLTDGMVSRYVRYLVRNHTCHFCFIVRSQNEAAIHVHKSARQGHGVHFIR